jgi:tetratricopeptide (TPR) repeat protein
MKYAVMLVVALVLATSGALGLVRGEAPDPAGAVSGATSAGVSPDAALSGIAGGDVDTLTTSLEQRLRTVPGDDRSWATLALLYVEQAHATGDADYYAKAERAVARSLELRPVDNSSGHAVAAALAAARHDFSGALREADTALRIDEYDATALSVRVDALTELGRYDDARRAAALADLRRPGVPTAIRYAYQQELRGRLGRSARVLTQALEGAATSFDRGELLPLLSDLHRRQGRFGAAGRAVALALREQPDSVPALVSRARLLVARGDLDAAARTWRDVVRRLPTAEHLTELGELELTRGRPAAARTHLEAVDASLREQRRGGVGADLETAIFESDHGDPARAISAARAEWDARRSIHAADAYAWALHRQGRDREALRLALAATRLGTQEAQLWLHRGSIEAALGLTAAARTSLQRGLAADPGASPWPAARARAVLRSLR